MGRTSARTLFPDTTWWGAEMGSPVRDIDRGFKRIKRLLAKASRRGPAVGVGVQAAEAKADHNGITNAELAAVHEFGKGNVPERSFLRSTFDENLKDYDRELESIAKRTYDGSTRLEGDLLLLGESMRSDVIQKIRSSIPPPLKPETVARKKGETTPLIDTGQLINALSVEVRK